MTLTISIYGNVMYMGCYVAGFCGLIFLIFLNGNTKGCAIAMAVILVVHDPDSGQPSTKSSLSFTLINVQFLKSDIQILLKLSI